MKLNLPILEQLADSENILIAGDENTNLPSQEKARLDGHSAVSKHVSIHLVATSAMLGVGAQCIAPLQNHPE